MSQVIVNEPTSFVGGRFQVRQVLGKGGMATVYLVYDPRLEVLRALKVLDPYIQRTPEFRTRFLSEARLMAQINDRRIVQVYDTGEEEEKLWILMEYVKGCSLVDRVDCEPLEPLQAVDVCVIVLSALAVAHGHKIIHRDIKPHNILLTPEGEVKLTDFGIARSDSPNRGTKVGTRMGTPGFMSPEQDADASSVDRRTDIYAMGALLHCVLKKGVPPRLYDADKDPQMLAGILEPLASVIRRATQYRREDRYESAEAMIAALQEARESLPSLSKDALPLVLPVGRKPDSAEDSVDEEFERDTDPGTSRISESPMTIVPPLEIVHVEGTGIAGDSIFEESGVTFLEDDLPPPRRRLPVRVLVATAIVLILILFVGIKWLSHSDELGEESIAVSTEIETPPPEVQAPTPEPVVAEPVVEAAPQESIAAPDPEPKPEMVRTEVVPPKKAEERPVVALPKPTQPSSTPTVEAVSVPPSHVVITALKVGQSFSPVVRDAGGQCSGVNVHLLFPDGTRQHLKMDGGDGKWSKTIPVPEGTVSFKYYITAEGTAGALGCSSGSFPNPHPVEIK